ncbi:MAG: LytTR family transcriptional regulator DNA-binding domain-containing protein [Candidatus Aminicenantes bacterium]|nr:LytTR family transcriptional regulator DNA-binding domain-containing protein [Candidatus Aminicenantes bacterium]
MWSAILRFLKQPNPIRIDAKLDLTISFLVGLFVFLFLLVFQPFGLSTTEPRLRYLLISGYGIVCFLVLAVNLLLIPRILKKVFHEETWTVYKRLAWHLWIVFSIGLGNYLFACLFNIFFDFYRLGSGLFISFQWITFLIALFPIVFYDILNQNYWLKRNLRAAEEISARLRNSGSLPLDLSGIDRRIVLLAENERERYEFRAGHLLYVSSEGNYVEVWVKNQKVENVLIRNSLKRIEQQLKGYPFLFRCHRAYIVNIKRITKATGNAQGFKLILDDLDKRIPVARSYARPFKELLGIP